MIVSFWVPVDVDDDDDDDDDVEVEVEVDADFSFTVALTTNKRKVSEWVRVALCFAVAWESRAPS